MIRSLTDVGKLAREIWKRPDRWEKAARLAQTWAWPERLFAESVQSFEDRPLRLRIETTNECNADCVFCGYQAMKRPKAIMSMEVYEAALTQYADLGGGDLLLEVIVGDPLLDPTFLEKVALARARPEIARIETTTNGLAVDRHGSARLVQSGIGAITLSTAGFDRESYAEIFRVGEYDKMRTNVLALLRANDRAGRPVEITLALRTHRPLAEVLKDPDFQEILAYEPRIDVDFALDDWMGKVDLDALPRGFVAADLVAKRESCAWLYDGPIVFANGDVGLCGCRDLEAQSELVVGNVREAPLYQIWRSPRVASLRARFATANKPDLCRSCTRYRNLDELRSPEGLRRARLTRARLAGSRCALRTTAPPRRRLPLLAR
jgi:MoaA/NifB/PqqE/SkfB family radical SAM enzyme